MAFPANVEEVRETLKRIQKNLECPICLELLSDPYSTQCSHPFCRSCIYMVISSSKEARCPLCKEPISKRSMNENARLADIVEAVKSLEQAVIKDSGIPSTPPRPLHQHSREASGTPGVVLHSLLHPTPQKPAPGEAGSRLERQRKEMEGCKPTTSSGGCARPHQSSTASGGGKKLGSCPKQDLEKKKFDFNPSRKRVRFAGVRSGRRMPGSGRATGGVSQAALLRALEEADFAEPEHCGVASNPDPEQRPGHGTDTASPDPGDQFGSSLTDTATTSTESRGHRQREMIPPASNHTLLSQRPPVEQQQPVLDGNQAVDSYPCQLQSSAVSMRESLTVVQETPFIGNALTHSSDSSHSNMIGELGNQAGGDCHLDNIGTGASTAIIREQTTAAIVEETPLLRSCAGEQPLAEEATASSNEIIARERPFTASSDEILAREQPFTASSDEILAREQSFTASSDEILAKESQFADAASIVALTLSERTAPGTQTVEETQVNTSPSGASMDTSEVTQPTLSGRHRQHGSEIKSPTHCTLPSGASMDTSEVTQPTLSGRHWQYGSEIKPIVSPTQCIGETQFLQTREGSNRRHDGTSQDDRTAMEEVNPGEEEASISQSGDSTQSISPPAFVRETPFQKTLPTAMSETPFQKTPPTAMSETPFQKTPPTAMLDTPFQKTPPTAMLDTPFQKTLPTACTSSSNRPIRDQNSSSSTTPDLQELRSSAVGSSPSQSVPGKDVEFPICSSPKSTTVPICPPCFTSPPLRGSCGCLAAPSPSLNHSISPSIPLQNLYQGTGPNQERAVIPDTFPDVTPRPSLEQTRADSVPSSQSSPVVAAHSPALPGLYLHTSNTSNGLVAAHSPALPGLYLHTSNTSKGLVAAHSPALPGLYLHTSNTSNGLVAAHSPALPGLYLHTSNTSKGLASGSSVSLAGSDVTPVNIALPRSPTVSDMISAGDRVGTSPIHHGGTIPAEDRSGPNPTHHSGAGDYPGPSPTHHSDSMRPLSSDKETSPTAPTLSGSIPYSVTVIPDSLHPHSPEHIAANSTASPASPHTTRNNIASQIPASISLSSEIHSPVSDSHTTFTSTYTQWDSTCKSYLTSQEVEALRVQMEEKQREIQELEALLLTKSTNAAEDQDEGNPESDAVEPPLLDRSEPVPQTSSGQESRGSPTHHKGDHTPSPTNNTQCSAGVTVIAETVPDSLPPCNALRPTQSTNSQESNSVEACSNCGRTGNEMEQELTELSTAMQPRSSIITQERESAERSDRRGCRDDQDPTAAMQPISVSLPTGEDVGSPIPTPTPPDTDQHQVKTKLQLQQADDLSRTLQCPPSVGSPPSENQDIVSKIPEHGHPPAMGSPLVCSEETVSSRKRKIGSLEHDQKNASAVPPKRTKKSLIDQFVTRPRPAAAMSSVLQSADRLLKALRNPPKIVLESQTTMEVDSALASSTAKGCDENTRSSGSKKKTPKGLLRQAKVGLPAKSKRRAPLIVLDSQDVDTHSPPPLDVPLPDNHPFLSVSTSKRQQTSNIDLAGTAAMPRPTSPGRQPIPSHLSSPRRDTPLRDHHTASGQLKPSDGGDGRGAPVIVVTPGVDLSGAASPAETLKSGSQTPSFVGSGLSKLQLKQAQILAKTYGGRIASCFNGSTTHIIVLTDENGYCPRTVKYLQGLAAGKWIVGYKWVRDSLEAGRLLPERDYVAVGDHLSGRGSGAPLRAQSRLAAGEPGLFNRHNFLLVGHFTATSSDYLSQLVQLSGGRVVASTENFLPPVGSQTLTVCDRMDDSVAAALGACHSRAPVTSGWVLDSLSQYRLQPVEKYQLNEH